MPPPLKIVVKDEKGKVIRTVVIPAPPAPWTRWIPSH